MLHEYFSTAVLEQLSCTVLEHDILNTYVNQDSV